MLLLDKTGGVRNKDTFLLLGVVSLLLLFALVESLCSFFAARLIYLETFSSFPDRLFKK
jgi:hypothetical protein